MERRDSPETQQDGVHVSYNPTNYVTMTSTYFDGALELGSRVAHVNKTGDGDSKEAAFNKSCVVEEHVEVAR